MERHWELDVGTYSVGYKIISWGGSVIYDKRFDYNMQYNKCMWRYSSDSCIYQFVLSQKIGRHGKV